MYYINKGVKFQKGFVNTCIYNFNNKELLVLNQSDADRLLQGDNCLEKGFYEKLIEHGVITDDYTERELSPLNFNYELFDDNNTYQVCKTLYFEVTNKCNYYCMHCYARMSNAGTKDLDIDTYRKYIANLGNDLNFDVRLTGGEPFLNPNIRDLIDITFENIKPYTVHSIVTNGSFEYEKALYALEKGFELQISIYGMKEETFKKFARANVLYHKKTFTNLERLSKTSFTNQVVLLLSINSLTYDEIEEYVNFAKKYGFKAMLNRPASIGRAIDNWETLKLSPKQHINFNRYNKLLVKGYNRYCYHACRLTWSYVDINANVKPCAFIRNKISFGNLLDDSLYEIRNSDSFCQFRDFNASSFDKCNECEFKYACTGGCCGETLEYTGEITDTYPWCVVRPYKKKYLTIMPNEIYIAEKYSGGTFDFEKI